ncbi:MAG: twin-arginine translocation signal domain-containing protein, partial [Ktedonobacteraceae bacterium]|nr:twin-arginine translocation signal domain-containing protein [Ktedonobacteraceae bacterium]
MDTRNSSHLNRRQFLRAAAAVGTVAGAGILLDACSSPGSSSGPVTITVMYNQGELQPTSFTGTLPPSQAYYVNSFNELHKGSITAKFLTFDQTRLTAMLASGTPPDFVRTGGGSEMAVLMAKGVTANLQTHFVKSTVIKED